MSVKESLRSLALKSRPAKSQIVEFEGNKFEVRAPSVRARSKILQRAGVLDEVGPDAKKKQNDPARMQVAAVISCTFDPETGERVFEDSDTDVLLDDTAGGIVDVLAAVAIAFLNTSNDKAAAKND